MFLDDIDRGINKARNKWEAWDQSGTYEIDTHEVVVDFIDRIRLLGIKNIGDADIVIDCDKMRTKIMAGSEKYFPEVRGTQVIMTVKEGAGKVFVGQARRLHISKIMAWFLVCSAVCMFWALSGCASQTVPNKQEFKTPGAIYGAQLISTPRGANTPTISGTPEVKQRI